MKTIFNKKVYYLFTGILILILTAGASFRENLPISDNQQKPGSQSALLSAAAQGVDHLDTHGRNLAIDYSNCAQLYALQPDDTLQDVARVSATTEQFVLSRNNLESEDDLYPGLVLCLEDNDGGIIPPTGGARSGVEVTSVSADQRVTVRGVDFPNGASMNVYIFQLGVSNPNVFQLDSITIPANETFERSFQIPTQLRFFRNLIIRFRNPDENVSASATFINANVDRITPNECAEYYTVHSGDVLGVIAQDFNVSVERLVEINNLMDASIVFPGQMLCTQVK